MAHGAFTSSILNLLNILLLLGLKETALTAPIRVPRMGNATRLGFVFVILDTTGQELVTCTVTERLLRTNAEPT
jgi:hypothetical protein